MNHDCCHSSEKQSQKINKKIDPFLLSIFMVTALILAGVFYFGLKMSNRLQISADEKAGAMADSNRYDWGTIDIDGGIVTKSFTIDNKGSVPLKLYNVKTSCMCTTAKLVSGERESEDFGMHSQSSAVFEVNPGESTELVVEFDPAYHGPSGIGPISRTVTLNTNDNSHQTLTFQVNGNVVKN